MLVSQLGGSLPGIGHKAWLVAAIALGIEAGAGFGVAPILHLSLVGAIAVVVFGILTSGEARNAVDLDVILVIASAFGLGAAIQSSGIAADLGRLR